MLYLTITRLSRTLQCSFALGETQKLLIFWKYCTRFLLIAINGLHTHFGNHSGVVIQSWVFATDSEGGACSTVSMQRAYLAWGVNARVFLCL